MSQSIECKHCGFKNPSHSKYCQECGTKLQVIQKVFISHSHQDRHIATSVDKVLRKHSAETFLDQDSIQAGEVLSEKIEEGITWCNAFVLIWSIEAAKSPWVRRPRQSSRNGFGFPGGTG